MPQLWVSQLWAFKMWVSQMWVPHLREAKVGSSSPAESRAAASHLNDTKPVVRMGTHIPAGDEHSLDRALRRSHVTHQQILLAL